MKAIGNAYPEKYELALEKNFKHEKNTEIPEQKAKQTARRKIRASHFASKKKKATSSRAIYFGVLECR